MMNPESIQDALKRLRKTTGKTQAQFARDMGVSHAHIVALENRQRRLTNLMAYNIAGRTGYDWEALLKGKLIKNEP